jgi:hypothetical protein
MMLPVETIKQYYRVDSRDISFFRFVLEGYDGLAVLTTLDATTGNVVLAIAPGCEQDVAAVISGLKSEMLIEPAPAPEMTGSMADTDW